MSVPGASVFCKPVRICASEAAAGNAQYQYTIQSDNLDDLVKWGPILRDRCASLPGFTDVNSDQQNDGLQAHLTYDRETASRLGITPQPIDNTLYQAFGQAQVSDDVHRAEPVSRRDGSRPAVLARARKV